jgi:hypothetical protein
LLIVGRDLKRESFVMLERGAAVEAETRDAGDREFHRQHVALLAGGIVTGCTMDGAHGAVGKGLGVEAGSSLCVLIVPQANRVLGHCIVLIVIARSQRVRPLAGPIMNSATKQSRSFF